MSPLFWITFQDTREITYGVLVLVLSWVVVRRVLKQLDQNDGL